ncbi:MAG: glycosyltransferase family 4 protein [Candidatus Dormibacteraceae bacterium]
MSPRPLVAVDAGPAARRAATGTELYAREVSRRLPAAGPGIDWAFYSPRPAPGLGLDLFVMPFPRLWSQARLPLELVRRRPRLFFAPAHVIPFWCPAPALTVVHDLAFERYPGAYGGAARAYLRATTRWAERVCPTLIAVSEATRQDLVSMHGIDPRRIVVIPPGGGEPPPDGGEPPSGEGDAGRLRALGIDRPFALHVGRVEARKNQLAALGAVERIPDLLLVCAGSVSDPVLGGKLGRSPRCRLLGRVDDEDREILYRQASALVFPSLHEGFGFPVLEAMGRGLPVVTVRISSLPEVAGEAALYVDDPGDAAALSAQLERLLGDAGLRARLVTAGRERAALFTWDRCVGRIAEVIRSLIQ